MFCPICYLFLNNDDVLVLVVRLIVELCGKCICVCLKLKTIHAVFSLDKIHVYALTALFSNQGGEKNI